LKAWEEDLFDENSFLGKRSKIQVRLLQPPYVEQDIDEVDVRIGDQQ